MPDFRIIIDIKDVTDGDAEGVAQDIWDTHANDLDAKLGDFKVRLLSVQSGAQFDTNWQPAE
jgi:hypothetical protein